MQKQEATGFGVTSDGKEAHLYTLENKNGMKACVSDYGAVLVDARRGTRIRGCGRI